MELVSEIGELVEQLKQSFSEVQHECKLVEKSVNELKEVSRGLDVEIQGLEQSNKAILKDRAKLGVQHYQLQPTQNVKEQLGEMNERNTILSDKLLLAEETSDENYIIQFEGAYERLLYGHKRHSEPKDSEKDAMELRKQEQLLKALRIQLFNSTQRHNETHETLTFKSEELSSTLARLQFKRAEYPRRDQ